MTEPVHTRIKDIGAAQLGQAVRIKGWLANKPGGKGRYFLWLRDGSGLIQAVAEQAVVEALPDGPRIWADIERSGLESSLIVDGEVRAHPKQEGVYELGLTGLTVVHCTSAESEHGEYPIGKKEHGTQFLMANRHLWLRGRRQSAILRIRSEIHKAWADFFYDRGFYRVDTPIFTPNACEGTTTLFEVDYHGDTVYLSQSGQLYNEADIGALGQVYCFGPTFRAEKSKTRRHLLEFWMLEMEAAFYDFDMNIRFQEEMLAFTVQRILDRCSADLKELGRDPAKLEPATQTPYPRLRYGDAIAIINETAEADLLEFWKKYPEATVVLSDDSARSFKDFKREELLKLWWDFGIKGYIASAGTYYDASGDEDGIANLISIPKLPRPTPFKWGDDFGAPDEAAISAQFDRPVFVTNFPTEIKGFYFKQEEEEGKLKVDDAYARLLSERSPLVPRDSQGQPISDGHTVLGADCIGPEGAGEMIGGSERETDMPRLLANIEHHKLDTDLFQWYLDTRRYGNVPHSGFGIGLERFTAWVCGGLDEDGKPRTHIRETITFPRMLHQYQP